MNKRAHPFQIKCYIAGIALLACLATLLSVGRCRTSSSLYTNQRMTLHAVERICNQGLVLKDGSRLTVPHVRHLPDSEVLRAAVGREVAVDEQGNVFGRLRLYDPHRWLSKFIDDVRWINLTELAGVLDTDSLQLTGGPRDQSVAQMVATLEKRKGRLTSLVEGRWHINNLACLGVVRVLVSNTETNANETLSAEAEGI